MKPSIFVSVLLSSTVILHSSLLSISWKSPQLHMKTLEMLTDGEWLIRVIPLEGSGHPDCVVVDGGGTCCFVKNPLRSGVM